MDLKTWLKKAGLTALGVAAGAVPGGGLAKDIITGLLGVDDDTTDAQIIQALEADPEKLIELKRIETEHERELIALGIEGERVRLSDVAGARERDVKVQTLRGGNWRADVLAFLVTGGLLACILAVFIAQIPDGPARDLLLLLFGSLTAAFTTIVQFEFGSSNGSKSKDAILGNVAHK
jgi:hypothetical protein